ncbi:hydroxymethylpyrimidine/phosphomethylpyrimidine kinase [Pedobacter sp. MC2016-24]|uniref:hydroxymethylpyrimidine/phosphomethylpyrimidine kinase n=1 Tax=Pedobacter sp. MC2016-24 TaxID=2780090 RepID=UPI00187F7D22|nr:hydroxymethylpyrimidine/phosphomethylpyrimidine kinase [Pedobacter sp. MC2016-24]MBE9598320.1 hydroxymethylpyrimidine/phosphomethylpyrimidine kinase [Pedobacter sp. MC2016-24]
MQTVRPYVMSIAGFDPSAGAGLLADIKCFEQHRVYGFGVCSAMTTQTDSDFLSNEWQTARQIIDQTTPLLKKFKVQACKIGLIKDLEVLEEVLYFLKAQVPAIKIVLDPVLKASAGYHFHDWNEGLGKLKPILKQIDLITPNYPEMKQLSGPLDITSAAIQWSSYCAVLLKGGHSPLNTGTDYLFENGTVEELFPAVNNISQKHGSGCVLSAAITARLALAHQLPEACILAKKYVEQFLNSNTSLLGYHKL